MKARSPVIDWDRLKQQGVHPSFCLPSSYHAVRAHVPLASIREMCDKHPHDEFHNMCYREAVVIPLLLNQPEGTNLDNQVYRAHVERSRRCLGHTAPSEEKRRDAWEVKAGRPLPSLDLGHTWQDLVKVLNAETPRNNVAKKTQEDIDMLRSAVSLDNTPAVEGLLEAAGRARCSTASSTRSTWTTPIPQPLSKKTVHLQAQDVESTSTTGWLEQELPARRSRTSRTGWKAKHPRAWHEAG
mmetsp:Transcript_64377/g.153703  ORF Transcript_64377/g.153703 Transcript_64377/m.153703 type:complete len:241 (+) Transcript_64377:42-764(+)